MPIEIKIFKKEFWFKTSKIASKSGLIAGIIVAILAPLLMELITALSILVDQGSYKAVYSELTWDIRLTYLPFIYAGLVGSVLLILPIALFLGVIKKISYLISFFLFGLAGITFVLYFQNFSLKSEQLALIILLFLFFGNLGLLYFYFATKWTAEDAD